jgi:hypothetical protein
MPRISRSKPPTPFKHFNSSPEIIRLMVLLLTGFQRSKGNGAIVVPEWLHDNVDKSVNERQLAFARTFGQARSELGDVSVQGMQACQPCQLYRHVPLRATRFRVGQLQEV